VKPPRFRIAWLMVAVAIAAFDSWAIFVAMLGAPQLAAALIGGSLSPGGSGSSSFAADRQLRMSSVLITSANMH
jgi:hypothetical protein